MLLINLRLILEMRIMKNLLNTMQEEFSKKRKTSVK